jgi:diguanylate cyclase (GGDEF)-like protein/PAS domain S-box-containing protein
MWRRSVFQLDTNRSIHLTASRFGSPVLTALLLHQIVLCCAVLTVTIGVLVLVGWALAIPALKGISPKWPQMAPVSALAFVLGGASLLGIARPTDRPMLRSLAAQLAAAALALIALVELCDHIFDWHLISDLLGFGDVRSPANPYPTIMAPAIAVALALIGAALLLATHARRTLTFQALTIGAALIGWLGVCDYLYGGTMLLPYERMDLLAAVGVVILACGVLCMRPDGEMMRLLRSDTSGGLIARRLLAPALVVPFATGLLQLVGQRAGWYGTAAGVSLFALADAVTLGTLVWISAYLLHHGDLRHRADEATAHRQAEQLASIIANEPECVKLVDRDGRLLEMNPAGLAMLEVQSLSEVRGGLVADFIVREHIPRFEDLHRRVIQGGSGTLEFEMCTRRGARRWVETHAGPLHDEQGTVWALLGITRDVTERRRQEVHIRHLTRVLKMQSSVTAAVLHIAEPAELLLEACRIAAEVGGYDHAFVTLLDPGDRTVRVRYRAGRDDLPQLQPFPIDDRANDLQGGMTGQALRTGEIAICADLRRLEPTVPENDLLLRLGIHSVVALPLRVEGAIVGALSLLSSSTELLQDDELALLQDIAATLGFGLRSLRQAEAARFLTYYDPMTGLAKRALFCERFDGRIAQPLARPERPILVAFDIHDLSGVNDAFGRLAGDALVRIVAERVKSAVTSEQQAAYLGAGTFVLAAPEVAAAAANLVEFLDASIFGQPFEIAGRTFRLTYHSGIAQYPQDGRTAAELLERAEAALQHAKQSGERYVHFRSQMHNEVMRRLQLEHELREAAAERQFVLHYQPQVSLPTGKIESVEALIRWRKPDGQLVPPATFVPTLESTGMIVPVGEWVLEQAARDCRWCKEHGIGPLRIGVNVSGQQIRRQAFVERLLRIVDGWSDADFGLDIEITESNLLEDMEDTRHKLMRLREAGIRVAIDDFGTGYSALGLLPALPIDILKIDRVFIRGLPEDRASVALTSSIVQIASSLDLLTVAEGVETTAQLAMLRELRCGQTQGYLHSRPVPLQDLLALMGKEAPKSLL